MLSFFAIQSLFQIFKPFFAFAFAFGLDLVETKKNEWISE